MKPLLRTMPLMRNRTEITALVLAREDRSFRPN